MAFRSDVTVDWEASPRIITVASPSTEITIQDLHDTCVDLESRLENLDDDVLISSAGKEDLGGGVSVGVTATLLNALLAFQARSGPTYEQCRVNGGNLVALDANGVTQPTPIEPTAFTQVITTASSSATTQSQAQLEYSTFNGYVSLDTINGTTGTAYPKGTPSDPVNGLTDALAIANQRGFNKIFCASDFTFGASDVIDDFVIEGESFTKTTITLTSSATITNCKFINAFLDGQLDGGNDVVSCRVGNLNYIDGIIYDSELEVGTITLGGTQADFIRCYSGVAGGGANQTPVIDMGGSGTSLVIRDYQGGIKLTNYTSGTDPISIDMSSGRVVFDPTISAGSFTVRGVGFVEDNSTGTATVISQVLDANVINHNQFDGAVYVDTVGGVSGTQFPKGTLLRPVGNWADALTIANNNGFSTFRIISATTLPTVGDFTGKKFVGAIGAVPFTIPVGANVDNCSYEVLQLIGEMSGTSLIRDCLIVNVTGFNGIAENSVIAQSITMDGTSDCIFVNCYSAVDVTNLPEIHFNGGATPNTVFRGYIGDIKFSNLNSPTEQISIDFESGDLIIDPTVTAGTIVVRGVGTLTDNSTGTAVVISKILNADRVNNSVFDGEVTIDVISGQSGTEFPLGTRSFPVSSLADAKTIATRESLNKYRFIGDYTFLATDDISNLEINGSGNDATQFVLTSGVNTNNALIQEANVNGVCGGYTRIRDCEIRTSLSNIEGLFENCIFRVGTYTLIGDNTKLFVANNCKSGVVTGEPQPIFDCNGDGASFIVRAYSGPFQCRNKTNNVSGICFDFISGKLVLDSTITAGHFPVRGAVYVVDNTTGAATTELEGSSSAFQTADFVWDEATADHVIVGSTGEAVASGGSGGLSPTQEATLNRIDSVVKQIEQYVFVDTELLVNGDGSARNPYNNVTDAKDFAEANEIFQIITYSEITIDRNLKNFNIIGVGNPVVNFNNQVVDQTKFSYCTLRGQYTGTITAQNCVLDNGFYLNGFFENCGANGTLTCVDGGSVLVKNCASLIAGTGRPTISMNGVGSSNLAIRDWQGGLTITDCNNALDAVTVEIIGGSLTFDATCTAGTMVARGLGIFVDNSNGATVIDETAFTQLASTGATPEEIWTHTTRTLTDPSGLTAEQDTILRGLPSASEVATEVLNTEYP